MNHLQRHAIGYATIGAGVVNVLIEKIEGGWPNSAQQWTLLVLAAIVASICRRPTERPAHDVPDWQEIGARTRAAYEKALLAHASGGRR